jgi:predicted membrane channel-forming protein YqfA (hemolysin III family)
MELREALTQITEIRLQMARTEVFRGYRALPAAFSGAVALGAACLQTLLVQDPPQQISVYLWLWIGAAVVSGMSALLEMGVRARNATSPLTRELTYLAIEQFCPCLVAGALLTMVVVRSAPQSVWILPGVWQVLYSLGIFASCRLLPRAMFGVAVFYLMCGTITLALAQGEATLSPWAMGVPFGVGQLLAAAVLYQTLERDHDTA